MTDVLAPRRDPADPPRPPRPPTSGGWFRAVWRWQLFASFLVVPVLLLTRWCCDGCRRWDGGSRRPRDHTQLVADRLALRCS
jgi:hypothetical protein